MVAFFIELLTLTDFIIGGATMCSLSKDGMQSYAYGLYLEYMEQFPYAEISEYYDFIEGEYLNPVFMHIILDLDEFIRWCILNHGRIYGQ